MSNDSQEQQTRSDISENDIHPSSTMPGTAHQKQPEHLPHKKMAAFLAGLFLVVVIGGLVYYLTSTKEATPSATETRRMDNSQNSEATEPVSSSLSQDWLEVSARDFKIKLPDGWQFTLQDNEVLISDCSKVECYELSQGIPATVKMTTGGRGGPVGVLVMMQSADIAIDELVMGYTQHNKLPSNFTVYKKTTDREPSFEAIGDELPRGAIEYLLIRPDTGGRTAYIYYSLLPEQPDPSDLIEEMAMTFVALNERRL